MILGGNIVGKIADLAVVSVGGSLVPLADPGLPVGARVQLLLVPGSTYRATLGSSKGASRLLMLDGRMRIVLRVRRGDVPAGIDLQLRPVVAATMARSSGSLPIEAVSIDRDNILLVPAGLRALFAPQQSGPIPQ